MMLANGKRAILRQFNRDDDNEIYDDESYKDKDIKIVPYKMDDTIKFGISSYSEATGFFQIDRRIDVLEGDQVIFQNKKYTVLKLADSWLFGRIENKIAYVK